MLRCRGGHTEGITGDGQCGLLSVEDGVFDQGVVPVIVHAHGDYGIAIERGQKIGEIAAVFEIGEAAGEKRHGME